MGRRRIPIEIITNRRNQQSTFNKRKNGLIKKAYELSVLCECKVALLISRKGKLVQYSSCSIEDILAQWVGHEQSQEQSQHETGTTPPVEIWDNQRVAARHKTANPGEQEDVEDEEEQHPEYTCSTASSIDAYEKEDPRRQEQERAGIAQTSKRLAKNLVTTISDEHVRMPDVTPISSSPFPHTVGSKAVKTPEDDPSPRGIPLPPVPDSRVEPVEHQAARELEPHAYRTTHAIGKAQVRFSVPETEAHPRKLPSISEALSRSRVQGFPPPPAPQPQTSGALRGSLPSAAIVHAEEYNPEPFRERPRSFNPSLGDRSRVRSAAQHHRGERMSPIRCRSSPAPELRGVDTPPDSLMPELEEGVAGRRPRYNFPAITRAPGPQDIRADPEDSDSEEQ